MIVRYFVKSLQQHDWRHFFQLLKPKAPAAKVPARRHGANGGDGKGNEQTGDIKEVINKLSD